MSETRNIVSPKGDILGSVTLDGKPSEDDWKKVLSAYLSPNDEQPEPIKSYDERIMDLESKVRDIEITLNSIDVKG